MSDLAAARRMAGRAVRHGARRIREATWRDALPGVPEVLEQARPVWHKDVLVGISVAAVAIPASLGMAELAGLPPNAGLYSTMVPLIAYALIGSSRKLIVGPDGALSSLTATTVAPLALGAPAKYAALAAMLAILTGAVMFATALFRLGFMADFLSKPVLIGYFNGIALTIVAGQAGKLLGVKTTKTRFFPLCSELLTGLGQTSLATAALSATLILVFLVLRRIDPRLPAALVVVVGATAASTALDLSGHGVATVGHVTGGIPVPAVPAVSFSDLTVLALAAVGMALVSFGDVLANGRLHARRDHYDVVPGRELSGVGLANVVAGLMHGQPVSSSGSRTAVADAAGARTQVVGITVALVTLLVTLFATPALTDLPKAALSVVLVFAAAGMFSTRKMLRLRRVGETEMALAFLGMVAVLVFGVLGGLLVAIALSIGVFVQRTVRPHDAVLGTVADIDGWHDVSQLEDPQTVPGLVVYRFDAPLFFPNSPYFRDQVREVIVEKVLASRQEGVAPVRWLLVNGEAVTYVDSTAEEMLRELHAELAAAGITLAFARVKWPIRKVFDSSGLTAVVGAEYFFPTVRAGVRAYLDSTASKTT